MTWTRTYSDEQLIDAIATTCSWRGVLRELGLVATSAGAMRSVRAHADRLRLDYGHFKGQRRWSEDDLRRSVESARTWPEVAGCLGMEGVSALAALKGHAARLGLDVRHLEEESTTSARPTPQLDITQLGRAGPLLAAAWFTLAGREVSWPLEPSRYDLLVCSEDEIRRVQVKTTTVRKGSSWKVYLSTSRQDRRTYTPDEVDDFFIIDAQLRCYLIPVARVGGFHAIHLAGYVKYQVAGLGCSGRVDVVGRGLDRAMR